ncbi:cobalamin-dependent protein [Geobacter pelophilus]|uniref:Cobalamin-dependent protein n=1 Tax=Geoanaerobacter pelophilus TaxID=60036 RepID=A0AAW4KYA3_9BACT|nr:lipid biosynthesis B12-binding/radical SAM protein [Geoanaerobacter pelophilus]MBT0663344.1 cobalamin-dependent protein [Geoanaerobacter pelophilus]
MKLLLISANRERSPYPVFPIGLACLAPSLAASGHELRGLDLCFSEEPIAAITAALDGFNADAAIISIRNIDNVTWPGVRSYLAGVREVVAACRERAMTIVGGSGFSIMPSELLAFLGADYGVAGEGEEALPRLLAAIAAGETVTGIPGVVLPGKPSFLPPVPVHAIATPDRTLFDVASYHKLGGMANLQTKRGCPFSCTYCTYPLLEGAQVRIRPVAEIIAEIRALVEGYGVNYLYFVDDIFNYPVAFAEELCGAMSAAKLPVNWSAFINPDFLPSRLLDAMLAAGCDALEFGTDSGAQTMLTSLRKSFSVETIRESSRLCRERGVDFAHYILFGGPGETEATVHETFSLMDELQPTAVIGMTGIRIFPGTELHRLAIAEGVVTAAESLLEPKFYISAAVRDTLCDLVTAEALQRTNWVVPGLEINISDAMLEMLRHFPVRGPLWKLMKRLGRSRIRPV